MIHKIHASKTTILALILCLATAGSAAAAGGISIDSSLISWNAAPGYQLTLTVSGAGQVYRYELGAGEPASFSIFDEAGQLLADGNYTWQLSAAPVLSKDEVAVMAEARAAGVTLSAKAAGGFTESGYFTVSGGAFATPSALEDVPDKAQVILDDLIVAGSACIGFDCVNGESFGFDTLRLKENNLRIKFQDTSSSASFPGNDWQLTANDSSNGGANKFSVDDIDSGKTPFTIEAGAPSNSLYVASEGRLGIRTATPAVDIHAVKGDSPTLRLEQDGSSGFTPQTWDLAGNETNFFVRDVTNGSKLPFRIKPGAPDNAISIGAGGDVGMGLQTATGSLHVQRTDGSTQVRIEDTSSTIELSEMLVLRSSNGQGFSFENSSNGAIWSFLNNQNGRFAINSTLGTGNEFLLNGTNGNLTISGTLTTGGPTCGSGCDRVFADDYELPTIEDHAAEMWQNGYLPAVGPTLPKAPINISEKAGNILNELEKAHIFIEQLNDDLKAKDARLATLEDEMEELKALVAAR